MFALGNRLWLLTAKPLWPMMVFMKSAFSKENEAGYRAPAVSRALRILRLLGETASPLGVSDIARVLRVSKGSVHGVLQALREQGAVEESDGKKFRLGPLLEDLASRRRGLRSLAELCRPHLERLSAETGQTAILGVQEGSRLRIEASVEGSGGLRVGAVPGVRIPLLAGATGKVAMAWGGTEVPETPHRFTAGSLLDRGALLREVETCRKTAVALDRGEYVQGVAAAAAPVLDGDGHLVGIIYALGFLDQLGDSGLEAVAARVANSAQALNRELADLRPGGTN